MNMDMDMDMNMVRGRSVARRCGASSRAGGQEHGCCMWRERGARDYGLEAAYELGQRRITAVRTSAVRAEGELSGREGERSGHMWMATPDAVCSDPTGDDT